MGKNANTPERRAYRREWMRKHRAVHTASKVRAVHEAQVAYDTGYVWASDKSNRARVQYCIDARRSSSLTQQDEDWLAEPAVVNGVRVLMQHAKQFQQAALESGADPRIADLAALPF